MRKRIRLIVFGGVLISLIGCKTRQNIVSVAENVPSPRTETEAERSDSLEVKRLDYNWITYRANASISNVEPKNLNVFVVNRKDSIIYMTISKLGIEGGRLVLTPDSVKFLNHLSSNYYIGNYSLLERWTGFKADFYLLQSLLIGEELPQYAKSFLQASYGNFITVNSQPFFQEADFVIPKEDIRLNVQVKSVKLNEVGPTSIRIPEKYMPIKISD